MSERNVALITGVTGQDGSYLSEFLISKGYEVHGIIRRSSVDYRERIAHLEGHPHPSVALRRDGCPLYESGKGHRQGTAYRNL